MVGKKGIYFGLFVVASILLVSSFAFGQGDPDLEPFDATVGVSNQPPIIFSMTAADEEGGAPPPGVVIPVAGSTVNAEVVFIAQDPNGAGDLNDATADVTFTSPQAADFGGICTNVACPTCTSNQKQYSCIVPMEYYYEPGVWNTEVTIDDSVGQTATCGVGGSVVCTDFIYATTEGLEIPALSAISWASIDLEVEDQQADAPGSIILQNRGNLDLSDVQLTAFDLPGVNLPLQAILSERFSTGPERNDVRGGIGGTPDGVTDDCGWDSLVSTATQLPLNSGTSTITGLLVPHGPPGSDEAPLYFCLWDALSDLGLTDTSYSTNAPTGTDWDIIA